MQDAPPTGLSALLRGVPVAAVAMAALAVPAGPARAAEAGMTLDVCPSDYGSFPPDAPTLSCGCAPDAMADGSVRGANPYFYQSSLCRAARHAGAIGPGGGQILVAPAPDTPFFPAVTRNGVEAGSWGKGMGFRVVVQAAPAPAAATPAPAQPLAQSATQVPAQTPAAVPAPVAPAPARAGMTLDVCPSDYGGFPDDAPALACGCTPDAAKDGSVRGANPYFYQSSVCRAALHAGAIGPEGGQVLVTPAPDTPFFPAVTRNGVEASSWGKGSGFKVAAPAGVTRPVAAAAMGPGGMVLDVCPSDYGGFPDDAPALTCGCAPDAVADGSVRGANPYFYQSSVCRAALHAGAVGKAGGTVVVTPVPEAPFFPAVTRHGVEAGSWGKGSGFKVAAAPGVAATVAAVGGGATGMTLDVCPSDYGGFPDDAPTLTCGCAPDAMTDGGVRGANPYFYQSSVCRAALHAGALGLGGGQVVVSPAPDVPFFPAVTRHGVEAGSWGKGSGFKVAAVPGAQAPVAPPAQVAPPAAAAGLDARGQPVQAPVAETLRATGQVALYIRFRTGSADLDVSAAPTLAQLRDALAGAPELRLLLVGHTDNVGGRDYNRDLSMRRAGSVAAWLREQGIAPERLSTDGKGFDEPVADNATEGGRALNRRVQAIRLQ